MQLKRSEDKTSIRLIFILPVLLLMGWNYAYGSVGEPVDSMAVSDSLFSKHAIILVIRPNVTISIGKERPPVMDFLEAEMTAGVDDDLFALLLETTKDSSRIFLREKRDHILYKDGELSYVAPEQGCEKLEVAASFTANYSFVNMPMVSINEPRGGGQVSELRALFSIFDCSTGKIVWQKSHTVFVPMKSASYQELMKKMYDHIKEEIPYRP